VACAPKESGAVAKQTDTERRRTTRYRGERKTPGAAVGKEDGFGQKFLEKKT
jgi:hypothetical protein